MISERVRTWLLWAFVAFAAVVALLLLVEGFIAALEGR